jgi:RNA recognition motif-containing protein
LIWGGVFLFLVLTWAVFRIKKHLKLANQKLVNLAVDLKKIHNNLILLMNNSDIQVEEDDIDETKLYVGNIDYAASEAELAAHFARFGQIAMVNIPLDRYTGRARGFGFVTFKKAADAMKAMALDGSEFKGRQIQVNFARERGPSAA